MEPDIRMLYDLKDVIFDQAWLAGAENFELYYMYRDLYLSRADKEKLLELGLRYDVTIIPPRMLGIEYVKTAGHYHPLAPRSEVTYPELYEVLGGEALYLLQNQNLSDIVVVHARTGDKVVVPPDYGHITINCSNRTLKMSNFVARNFSSQYQPFRERRGGAYYCTREGFVKNPHYPEAVELRRIAAPDNSKLSKLGLMKGKEMYPQFRETGKLDYLLKPQEHLDIFRELI
ncbi:MAG: glucose-6-phosphate isomerase [Methanotrichaceae archaeon]|nr:glucose-6-phosphate isomerase [Methanotrichaceae archaeon]